MEVEGMCELAESGEREREKGEGRQLNSKPAYIDMWMRKGGTDENLSWWEMSGGMKGREMKAEMKVCFMFLYFDYSELFVLLLL